MVSFALFRRGRVRPVHIKTERTPFQNQDFTTGRNISPNVLAKRTNHTLRTPMIDQVS